MNAHTANWKTLAIAPLRAFVLVLTVLLATILGSRVLPQEAIAQSPPSIGFESASYSFDEDAGTVFLQIRLTNCGARRPTGTVPLRIVATDGAATEGEDYFVFAQGTIGTVVPEKNSSNPRVFRSLEVPLQIMHDDLEEPTEDFQLHIKIDPATSINCGSGPTQVNVGSPATVSIIDIPFDLSTVRFSRTEVFVTEGDEGDTRVARFEVVRLSGSKPVSALCQTTRAGTATEHQDFIPTAVVIGWGEDDLTTQMCEVPIVSDDTTERSETVQLLLEPLKGSLIVTNSNATVRIADDDSPGRVQFSATRFEAYEGGPPAKITVVRKGGTEGEATVVLTVRGRGAKIGKDVALLNTRLTWADGEGGSETVEIEIVDDQQAEPIETFILTLESAQPETLGDLRSAVLAIRDNDTPP